MPKKSKDDYKVGYGKPPKSSQFKKGQSGNPNGRPRKKEPLPVHQRTPHEVFRSILHQKRFVTIDGQEQELSTLEVIYHAIIKEATKGNPTALKLLKQMITEADEETALNKLKLIGLYGRLKAVADTSDQARMDLLDVIDIMDRQGIDIQEAEFILSVEQVYKQ